MRTLSFYKRMMAILLLLMVGMLPMKAQKKPLAPVGNKIAVRYVHPEGQYKHPGTSWALARNDLQATINELYNFLQEHSDYTVGHIYVAGGANEQSPAVYMPTESTGEDNTGVFFTAFKIKAGIEIYGGFNPSQGEDAPEKRVRTFTGAKGWQFAHPSMLTGNHTRGETKFTWSDDLNRYDMSFPRNSFHVVWFATGEKKLPGNQILKGFDQDGRALPLEQRAVVDGFIIEGGNASETNIEIQEESDLQTASNTPVKNQKHTSFGGGVYMVGNSVLRNCEVRRCHATRAGGAVYMDGGGRVDQCYVHTSQCEGIGLTEGYGGGVCVADSGLVTRSIIVDNMARIGGGLALVHHPNPVDPTKPSDPATNPEKIHRYVLSASATIVGNNTSTTEAGGVLLMNGGTLNQMTIVHNRCVGGEVIVNDRRYGLSGGAYIEKSGIMFNSVLYGNRVGFNNLQYATYGGNSQTGDRPYVHYGAVEYFEKTDWSGTVRFGVIPLYQKSKDGLNEPEFHHVPLEIRQPDGVAQPQAYECAGVQAGGTYSRANLNRSHQAEMGQDLTPAEFENRFEYYWKPLSYSPLRTAGVKLKSFITDPHMHYAESEVDLAGKDYSAKSTLGAFNAEDYLFTATKNPEVDGQHTSLLYTLFVDPQLKVTTANQSQKVWGNSWDTPFFYLDDALNYVRQVRDPNKKVFILDAQGKPTTTQIPTGAVFQILMKEGEGTIASNHFQGDLHEAAVLMVENTRLYGSFPKSLTGTDLETKDGRGRNPKVTPTVLTADVMKLGKERNADHIIIFDGVENVVLDGFHLEKGYAVPEEKDGQSIYNPVAPQGAGIRIVNSTGTRMTGNVVRNCRIANCTAEQGAAVYAWAKGTQGMDFTFENCLIHNNTSKNGSKATSTIYLGAAEGTTNVSFTFNHCDVVKNVGNPIKTNKAVVQLTLSNSVIWANANQKMANSELLETTEYKDNVLRFNVKGATIQHCAFDKDTQNTGATSLSHLTYQSELDNFPTFVNPTKNIGAVYGIDQTYYGGRVDFTPRNMSPLVNAANDDVSGEKTGGTDFTVATTRNYGGAADIGALENSKLPENGKVIYVRAYGGNTSDPGGDGSSWENAINGNYHISDAKDAHFPKHSFSGVDAEIPSTGMTGLQWAVDEAFYRSLKKNGGSIEYTIFNYTEGYLPRYSGEYTDGVSGDKKRIKKSQVLKDKLVEVWVGAGTYTKATGFFMRDGVDVYGGFPAIGNPGMKQRSPRTDEGKTCIQTLTADEAKIAYRENSSGTQSRYNSSGKWGPAMGSQAYSGNKVQRYDLNVNYTLANQTQRVLTQPYPYYQGSYIQNGQEGQSIEFMNVPINGFSRPTSWDGFVIQNGRTRITHPRDGGAGVVVRYNGRIVNCVIQNNVNIGYHNMRGGGIFCNGGEVVNCIVEHNVLDFITSSGTQGMGGGLYLRTGTVYNTCFTQNASLEGGIKSPNGWSGAVHFENGKFYNNTITENTGNSAIRTGNWFTTGRIDMFNTIVFNNPDCVGDMYSGFSQYEIDLPSGINKAFGNCLVPQGKYDPNQITIGGIEGNIEMSNDDTPFEPNSLNLRLGSPAINAGNDSPNNIDLPTFDAAYDNRIQDCRVDIGAYEYNGAKEIQPTVDDQARQMVYYVSQNGLETGDMSANRANPACATKLQKVLDAAGRKRYELLNITAPTDPDYTRKNYEIVVRLAGDTPTPGGVPFAYTAERSTDKESGNPRNFSLIVPHGITLEGGWDETFANRDITANPTRISGVYQDDGQDVDVYHIVTFTDEVFGTDAQPIAGHSLRTVTQRTILDGLYLENGQANGETMIHQKGGVAIVPAYGHVRNCILKRNSASLAGGALHLQPKALVSGCLFVDNQSVNGGAISVAKVGEDLLREYEGDKNPKIPAVEDMAHIYTSTIVNNTATGSGGALWFDNNVRINSSVLWKNTASVDMNVSGQTNPNSTVNQEETLEFYPLAYCAVENVRVPGLNNISVNSANESGVRFKMVDNKIHELYEPTSYSLLGRAGMPIKAYTALMTEKGLAEADFMNIDRGEKMVGQQLVNNEFIEIGARAFNGPLVVTPDKDHLLRRLYVSKSNVNWMMVQALELLNDPNYKIYQLKGSSFAYPMQHLDDALEYVRDARKLEGQIEVDGKPTDMNNVKYEIFVSAGTYYPFHNIEGNYEKSSASTFVVPEGVSIYGGMDNSVLYGQERKKKTDKEEVAVPLPDGITLPNGATVIRLLLHDSPKMLHARERTDRNVNGIVEPWEMSHQTILSGNVVDKAENVHHVITCLPFQVGNLPVNSAKDEEYLQKYSGEIEKGKRPRFRGSRIVIDGLEIIDGEATQRGSTASYTNKNYSERGGGILVAGNLDAQGAWIQKNAVGAVSPLEVVGTRNIPLTVRNCRFNGNMAGEGAAIFTDGELKVYSCSFERNSAVASGSLVKGNGGAIAANYETTLINTIFENNEAGAETISGTTEGFGGAVYLNGQAWSHMLNCNFVRNWAKSYPALYFVTPNQGRPQHADTGQGTIQDDYADGADRNMVVNSIFWGNEVETGGIPFVTRYADPDGVEQKSHDAINAETTLETLWFCGYENGLGRAPRVEFVPNVDMREATFDFAQGSHFIPQVFEDYLKSKKITDDAQIAKIRKSNYNVWLNTNNFDLNGPNFSKPSKKAGAAGYDASSSWMVTRPNNLTDNGWTMLEQRSAYDANNSKYTFKFNGKGAGIYFNWYQQEDNAGHLNMALGADEYMTSSKKTTIHRVSINPDAKVKKTYIDIGVYEYRQIPLNPITYGEVDVLWVCEVENITGEDADGHTRERATSDLQRAIETLLSSRNGHHKEIRLLEGRYTPKYTLNVTENSNSGFLINTKNQDISAEVPLGTPSDKSLGVNSLAFRGGWNPNSDDYRDTKEFKSQVITTESGKSTAGQFKHLFYIKDALQRKSFLQNSNNGKNVVTSKIDDNRVVPIIFDGLVMSNEYAGSEHGSAIYYAEQQVGKNMALPPRVLTDEQHARHQPKLSVLRCEFVRNGAEKALAQQTAATSVVTIEGGGGKALVYNSVFHSNADHPLTAVNTDVLNCTFALNGKEVRLTDAQEYDSNYHSSMHNSVLWKNNATAAETYGSQLNQKWVNQENFTYNAVTGISDDVTTHNVNLSNKNSDLILGPNFVAPKEDATLKADILARNFSLLPSIRLLNSADADIYTSVIYGHIRNEGATDFETQKQEMLVAMKKDMTIGKHHEGYLTDINNDRRYVDHAIDRGAYEYQHPLLRVVYVNPRGPLGNGTSWDYAYNSLQMQDAIDMAAVYAHNAYQKNQPQFPGQPEKSHAYVFMKGSDGHTRADLMMRAGVSVYGSIAYDFNETVQLNEGDVQGIDEEQALADYVQQVRDTRPGMVEPRTERTVISSLMVSEGCNGRISLVDGLEVKGIPEPGETFEKISAPAVNLALTTDENTRVVMRNCIVDGFHNTNTADMGSENALNSVVRANHALLYNVLTFNNKVEHRNTPGGTVGQWVATVVVGKDSYVENCTMVASDVKEAQPIIPAFYIAGTSGKNVHNSYIYPGKTGEGKERGNSFCTYFDIPENTGEAYLCYQLSEQSKEIDTGTDVANTCPYKDFIDYTRDRDLLGNPRKIGTGHVDKGCFETWRTGTEGLNINMVDYGKNYYPHEGSVVYLYGPMVADNNFDKDELSAIRPGYLLLGEHGGWYGQGNVKLELKYAAVERNLSKYNLVALPFNYDYNKGSQMVSYDAYGRTVLSDYTAAGVSYYDSHRRADSHYRYAATESDCWQPVQQQPVVANSGVLYEVPSSVDHRLHRFTALSTKNNVFVYVEDETPKSVALHQANSKKMDKEGQPQFTALENMGWNMVGMPYLVYRYTSGSDKAVENYPMQVPHMIYGLLEDGNYEAKPSWEAGVQLAAGEAFFTQTAVVKTTQENVTFALPVPTAQTSGTQKKQIALRSAQGEDRMTVCPSAEATDWQYALGADGVKWMAFDENLPQIYLMNAAGTRFSWASAVPVATELKVGVQAEQTGDYTFSLPAKHDFSEFSHVWLLDRQEGVVTDLKAEEYTVSLKQALNTSERFTLKFGGTAPIAEGLSGTYKVFIRHGQLFIQGLCGGEQIRVYDAVGRDVLSAKASSREFTACLSAGVYIVKVNGNVYKVR